MKTQNASPAAGSERGYPWLRDGDVAPTRDDRIAEAIALVALIFSLSVGMVIAMLPVAGGPVERLSPQREWSDGATAPALPAQAEARHALRVSAK
jgi:hypothetical protein